MSKVSRIVMVTGGARSGKSALAEGLAQRLADEQTREQTREMAAGDRQPLIYLATAEPWDDEMTRRIGLHRDRRGTGWTTIEEPRDLAGALARSDGQGVRLVDCLTLWLSNILDADASPQDRVAALCATLRAQRSPVVLVTNELGLGIVPDNALARRFRDEHGWMNQAVAGLACEVWMAVSGLPLRLKPASL